MERSSFVLLLCITALPGRARAETPAPPVVAVPFGCGLSFPVTQVHAVGTHVDNDVWAWDFRMPEGTPVVAALDGVVRLARGDSAEGGCDPALARTANYVVLEHAGGLESQYLHFSRVVVQVGQFVRQGELLGYSGATGWACGPHLHFKVARPDDDGWNNPSIAARIAGYGDPALGTQVSSPPCAAPTVIAAGAPSRGPPASRVGGALLPAALAAPPAAPPSGTPTSALAAGARSGGAVTPAVAPGPRAPVVPAVPPALERAPIRPTPSVPAGPAAAPPPAPSATAVHAAS